MIYSIFWSGRHPRTPPKIRAHLKEPIFQKTNNILYRCTPPSLVTHHYCKGNSNLTLNVQELTLYTRRHEMDTKMNRKSAPEGTKGTPGERQMGLHGHPESTKWDPMGPQKGSKRRPGDAIWVLQKNLGYQSDEGEHPCWSRRLRGRFGDRFGG